jgi:hypothetical protein
VGPTFWRGKWRAFKNGGWEGEFGGTCKMEVCLEALLELIFCTKHLNFGVEAHIEAPNGVALISYYLYLNAMTISRLGQSQWDINDSLYPS